MFERLVDLVVPSPVLLILIVYMEIMVYSDRLIDAHSVTSLLDLDNMHQLARLLITSRRRLPQNLS